jgi:hypothetical protein
MTMTTCAGFAVHRLNAIVTALGTDQLGSQLVAIVDADPQRSVGKLAAIHAEVMRSRRHHRTRPVCDPRCSSPAGSIIE